MAAETRPGAASATKLIAPHTINHTFKIGPKRSLIIKNYIVICLLATSGLRASHRQAGSKPQKGA